MIKIVRARENHIPAICQLWLEFERFHQNINPVFTLSEGAEADFEEEMVRRLMKSEDGLLLVAFDGGRAVGYSLSEIRSLKRLKIGKVGAIDHLAVTADSRHQGVGEKMLDEILKWFRSKNIDRIELDVIIENKIAYSFWKKHGFTDYWHRLYRQI